MNVLSLTAFSIEISVKKHCSSRSDAPLDSTGSALFAYYQKGVAGLKRLKRVFDTNL